MNTKMQALKKRGLSLITALAVVATMGFATTTSAFAAAPQLEKAKYEGKGKVEVEFYGDVQWKKAKVVVKDAQGKKYKTTILKKDDDEIDFRIKGYKAGKTYHYTISGVKQEGTQGYGKVKGKVKIPKVQKGAITKAKAKSTAKNHAVKNYKIKAGTMRDYDIDKDTFRGKAVWEIDFEAKKADGNVYEYEYKIDRKSGKILLHEEDLED